MNPELDGWDQDDGLADDEFMYEGSVYHMGSPEHALLAAVATGANSWFFPRWSMFTEVWRPDGRESGSVWRPCHSTRKLR